MTVGDPILDLDAVRPSEAPGYARPPILALRLMPGDLALVDARDANRAAWFADLCCGLVPPAAGAVRFLGQDWTALPHQYAAALRGRIGRVFAKGGWIESIDTAANILLPQLHHTRRDPAALRETAARLASSFGLPGLPLSFPGDLSAADRIRAACVRAFLGEPELVLLESPVQGRYAELVSPLLNALAAARSRGAAAIWLTSSDMIWADRSFPATQALRLNDRGLFPARRAA